MRKERLRHTSFSGRIIFTLALLVFISTACRAQETVLPASTAVPPAPTAVSSPEIIMHPCEIRGWYEWEMGDSIFLAPGVFATLKEIHEAEGKIPGTAVYTVFPNPQGEEVVEELPQNELRHLGGYVVIFPEPAPNEKPAVCVQTIEDFNSTPTPPGVDI